MTEQVNKYYDGIFTFAQKATEQEVLHGKNLTAKHIENLCSGFLTNAIYADVVEGNKDYEQGREKAFNIAAQVVIKHGKEIEEQLKKNDEAALEAQNNLKISPSSKQEQVPSNQNQPNTSEDIKKISGGTMAQIIAKISEIMAAMSPEEQQSAAQNISALFSTLGKSFDSKIGQTMKALAPSPVIVANIKNILKETDGGDVFDKLIKTHLDDNQKAAIDNVSKKDLELHREEKTQQQKTQTGLSLS